MLKVKLRKNPSGGSYSNYAVQGTFQEPDINQDGMAFNFGIDLAVGDAVNLQIYVDLSTGSYNIAGDSTMETYWTGYKIG